MKAYRLFDDEWSDVCGQEQLREFAYEQIGCLDESDYRKANDRLVNIIADFQENNPVPCGFFNRRCDKHSRYEMLRSGRTGVAMIIREVIYEDAPYWVLLKDGCYHVYEDIPCIGYAEHRLLTDSFEDAKTFIQLQKK